MHPHTGFEYEPVDCSTIKKAQESAIKEADCQWFASKADHSASKRAYSSMKKLGVEESPASQAEISRQLAEEMRRRSVVSAKRMDMVKTMLQMERNREKEAAKKGLDHIEEFKSNHLPRKNSNRSIFDDEENLGGMSIDGFSKLYESRISIERSPCKHSREGFTA